MGTRGAVARCCQPEARDANGRPGDPSGPKGLCLVSPVPKIAADSSPGLVLPKNQVGVGSATRTDPERTEQMLDGVLAYRGRWVYCVQRGAVTGMERRLMYLGGRTWSDDPRGRTDESPPGGM